MDNILTGREKQENNFDYVSIVDKEKVIEQFDKVAETNNKQYTYGMSCLSNGNYFYLATTKIEGKVYYGINSVTGNDSIGSMGIVGMDTFDYINNKEEFLKKIESIVNGKIAVISDSIIDESGEKEFAITSNSLLSPYKKLRTSEDYKGTLGNVSVVIKTHKLLKIYTILLFCFLSFLIFIFASAPKDDVNIIPFILMDVLSIIIYFAVRKTQVIITKDDITSKKIFGKMKTYSFQELTSVDIIHVKQKLGIKSYSFKTNNNESISIKNIFVQSFQHEILQYIIQYIKNQKGTINENMISGFKHEIKALLKVFLGIALFLLMLLLALV